MTTPDPTPIVDPHARERSIPPLRGCFPPHEKRKGCFDKPPLPDLGGLESIVVHLLGKDKH